ncbi:hypothetical protein H4582DRAFT_1459647 [Lactarius indigo]|nr:hypothetical protein H4582DRAFT_1459647 [Lactarius indigo]
MPHLAWKFATVFPKYCQVCLDETTAGLLSDIDCMASTPRCSRARCDLSGLSTPTSNLLTWPLLAFEGHLHRATRFDSSGSDIDMFCARHSWIAPCMCGGPGHHRRTRSHRKTLLPPSPACDRVPQQQLSSAEREVLLACSRTPSLRGHRINKGPLECRQEHVERIYVAWEGGGEGALGTRFRSWRYAVVFLCDAFVLRCQHRMRRSESNAGRWNDVSVQLLSSPASKQRHASKVRQQRGALGTPRVRHPCTSIFL